MQHSNTSTLGKAKSKLQALRNGRAGGKSMHDYHFNVKEVPKSPITLKELQLLKETVLWTEEDTKYIRMSREVLEDQTDLILEVWDSFVQVTPHLAAFFTHKEDQRQDEEYMKDVRLRFKQWMLDTAEANFDQDWLNYQNEIALQHHKTKKGKSHDAAAVPMVNFRYIPALMYPMTATLKPFLAKKHDHDAEDVECMYHAWMKAILLQVCLWSQPFVKSEEY